MDKKLAVHVAAETIVLGSLTVYLINRISALEVRISELEKDLQATAKHAVLTEKKQVEVLNAMSHIIKNTPQVKHHHPEDRNTPKHVVHTIHRKPEPAPVSNKKKMYFSDGNDEDQESSYEEEEPTPPPKMKAKGGKKKGIVVPPSEVSARRGGKNMDDTRKAAAALAPIEEDE